MWTLQVKLEPNAHQPLFVQIASAIRDAITQGLLPPGQRLPGTRVLAARLDVHRNTVMAAYRDLEAQGWVHAREGRGTFVEALSIVNAPTKKRSTDTREPGFFLAPPPPRLDHGAPRADLLHMAGGLPDVRLIPVDLLARAQRRALRKGQGSLLGYGDPQGMLTTRHALATMLRSTRAVAATADEIIVTRGSQMAIDLVARALLRPNDSVAIEAMGYHPAWEALRRTGATLVPIPIDSHGMDIDALETCAQHSPLRAVYLTPHHQYPTMAVLSAQRRQRLMAWAQKNRIAIIEDDYDNEFHYDGQPVPPLAANDPHGVVIYIGTLSKVLAPGLRLGFVAAPQAIIESLTAWRACVDRQGDQVIEAAVAELMEDGEVQRHVRKMMRTYRSRRACLDEHLRARLNDVLEWTLPPGGMAIWARVAPDVDPVAWTARARDRGVLVRPGQVYRFDGERMSALRLGFAALNEDEIEDGVDRLTQSLPQPSQTQR